MAIDMSWTKHFDRAKPLLQKGDFVSACEPLRKAREGARKQLDSAGEIIRSEKTPLVVPTSSFANISKAYAGALSESGNKREAEKVALDTWKEVSKYLQPPPKDDEEFYDRMLGAGSADALMIELFINIHQNETLPDGRDFSEHSKQSVSLLGPHKGRLRRLAKQKGDL